MSPEVAICIVTYNSAADLPGCCAAIAAQDYRPLEVVIVDCASSDMSVDVARRVEMPGIGRRLIALTENRGFAGGMNEAFRHTAAPYLLTLNADVRPQPSYVRCLLERFRHSPPFEGRSSDSGPKPVPRQRLRPTAASEKPEMRIAAVTGRLMRPVEGGERRLDACGMVLTRSWRHLDRGSGELDRGQWDEPQRVFGATGAATLFLREALADVAVDGEIFDCAFHSFREDAELCFRLRERGWEVIYEPRAGAEHRRRVLPERRRALPAAINYHSLKNRYLLRAYHQTPGNFVRTLVPALGRDLAALAYVLLAERSSLAAYGWLWRHRREILARRRRIQARRTVAPAAIDRWFSQRALGDELLRPR